MLNVIIPRTNHRMSVSVGLCWEYSRQIVPLGKECIDLFDLSSGVCSELDLLRRLILVLNHPLLPVMFSDKAKQTDHTERFCSFHT